MSSLDLITVAAEANAQAQAAANQVQVLNDVAAFIPSIPPSWTESHIKALADLFSGAKAALIVIACVGGLLSACAKEDSAKPVPSSEASAAVPAITAPTQAQVNSALAFACQIDSIAQPLAIVGATVGGAIAGAGPAVAAGIAVDQTQVHPAAVAACAKLNGTLVQVSAPAAGTTSP